MVEKQMNYIYFLGLVLVFGSALCMAYLGVRQAFTGHVLTLYFNDYHEGMFEAVLGVITLILIPYVFYKSIVWGVDNGQRQI